MDVFDIGIDLVLARWPPERRHAHREDPAGQPAPGGRRRLKYILEGGGAISKAIGLGQRFEGKIRALLLRGQHGHRPHRVLACGAQRGAAAHRGIRRGVRHEGGVRSVATRQQLPRDPLPRPRARAPRLAQGTHGGVLLGRVEDLVLRPAQAAHAHAVPPQGAGDDRPPRWPAASHPRTALDWPCSAQLRPGFVSPAIHAPTVPTPARQDQPSSSTAPPAASPATEARAKRSP